MRKHLNRLLTIGLILTFSVLSSILVFAGQWQRDDAGWWYQFDDGSYPTNIWLAIIEPDGSSYGNEVYFYFNETGYMLENCVTPDEYTVDENGRQIEGSRPSFLVREDKTYWRCIGSSVDAAFGNPDRTETSGWYYRYQGGVVPDTETFDLEFMSDVTMFRFGCEFRFTVDGRYSTVNHSLIGGASETWGGNYKREGNIITLYPDDAERPTDVFHIEDGRLWPQEMYKKVNS